MDDHDRDRPLPRLPPLLPEEDLADRPEADEAPAAPAAPRAAEPPRPRRRATRRPRPDEERRRWSAGHAVVVCALALGLSLLLNAPGVHKKAYNQPDGWQRDLALAFTGPLDGISDALLLDGPRRAVQALAGRSGEDEIDTEIVVEAGPDDADGQGATGAPSSPGASGAPTGPATPAKRAFTPKRKLRLWVAGDSLVITPGYAIVRATGASPVMTGLGVDGRVATGLTRPDVFNWFERVRVQVRELDPDVVVLGLGGNDDKAYMTGLPKGVEIDAFGDDAWRREYRRRVAALFTTIARGGAHAIWIGLPQTADPEQTRRFDVVNAVVAAEARRRPDAVTYLDTYAMFAGPDGGYAEYLDRAGGGSVKVRAGDGVHFERAGGDLIAREVLKALNQTYDLTSWRARARAD